MIRMKNELLLTVLTLVSTVSCVDSFAQDTAATHVYVYHEKGLYAGWPANFGIWSWGNELLVGFARGSHKDLGAERHNIDKEKPEYHLLARSTNGGESWSIEDPAITDNSALVVPDFGSHHGVQRTDVPLRKLQAPVAIDFTHPDLAFTTRMTNGDNGSSWVWYSYDRGKSWQGPSELPLFNGTGTAARTDYIVDGKDDCMLFLTAPKANGKEGRIICVKTNDGGKTWSFVSWIGPEPEDYAIMPASVRLSDTELLVTVRNKTYISCYKSADNGLTWTAMPNPVEDTGAGNPPAMIKMQDGRLLLVYGSRKDPYSILAKISDDNGTSWSEPYVLRNDGSGRDVGYARVVQRPDGKIVAVYYFMDAKTGPERYIGATIWTPPAM